MCVCVFIYVCMYAYLNTKYVYLCMYLDIYMFKYMCIYMCNRSHPIPNFDTFMYQINTYTATEQVQRRGAEQVPLLFVCKLDTCICQYLVSIFDMCIYIHVCTHIYMYIYNVCMYIYTYIQTHTHTHIHAHIHTHTNTYIHKHKFRQSTGVC